MAIEAMKSTTGLGRMKREDGKVLKSGGNGEEVWYAHNLNPRKKAGDEKTLLEKAHDWVYPPKSKYYWYRYGTVAPSELGSKYWRLGLSLLVMGSAASAPVMATIFLTLGVMMQEWSAAKNGETSLLLTQSFRNMTHEFTFLNESKVREHYLGPGRHMDLPKDPMFIVSWILIGGLFTLAMYYVSASYMINQYYVKRASEFRSWKIQHKFLSKEAELSEKKLGLWNGFVSGALGMAIFFFHQSHPCLKLHYEWPGFLGLWGEMLLVYLWVDCWSYFAHRALHHKFLYKRIHKVHHTWKQPTPFAAQALHPLEFLLFQSAGICCTMVFPVHVMAFLAVVVYVAYHNQVDHSGIDFEGELPWFPSARFHDNHHELFHLNFGVTLVFWDWLFDTLRKTDRVYGVDRFEGNQDQLSQHEKSQ